MSSKLVSISIDDISAGASCSNPVVGESNILLVGENTRITEHLISQLRSRGITEIMVDPRDAVSLKTGKRAKAKRSVDSRQAKEAMRRRPLKEIMVDRFNEGLSPNRTKIVQSGLSAAAGEIDLVSDQLCTQSLRCVSSLISLSEQHVETLVDDQDLAVGIVGGSLQDERLSRRSARLSVLGMAVAAEMGLNWLRTMEVGLAGLLHDVGLMVMDRSLRQPYGQMTEEQRWQYKKHPLVATACIESVTEVPHNVLLAIAQTHEQFDGSGYPRGLQRNRINQYARILNVVDSYLELTSKSRHRPALVPHDALGFLLHQAAKGIFDPEVIRAFLRVESLFPLGSQVELSNGEAATVIRRPRTGFSEPVVTDSDGKRIELEIEDVQIVRPIVDDHSSAVRMTQDLMKELEWSPLAPTFSKSSA